MLEDQFMRSNIWLVKGLKRENKIKLFLYKIYKGCNTWKFPRPGQHMSSDWKVPLMASTIIERERGKKNPVNKACFHEFSEHWVWWGNPNGEEVYWEFILGNRKD